MGPNVSDILTFWLAELLKRGTMGGYENVTAVVALGLSHVETVIGLRERRSTKSYLG